MARKKQTLITSLTAKGDTLRINQFSASESAEQFLSAAQESQNRAALAGKHAAAVEAALILLVDAGVQL